MNDKQNLTIPFFLNRSFEKYPGNPFLGFSDEKAYTYSEVKQQISAVISFLEKLEVRKGDKVAILSNNMPNWGITYFAVVSMGAVVVPLLPDFSEEEVKNILEHSEAKIVFCAQLLIPKIINIENEYLKAKIKINDFSNIDVRNNIVYDPCDFSTNEYTVSEDDLALLIYTSGTTGKSKGVMLSHRNVCFNAEKSGVLQPIFPEDKFLSFLPLSHAYEHTLGLILPMMNGASVYYLRKLPTPAVLIPAMQQVKPSIMLSVPLIIEKIYKTKILSSINSKNITKLLYKIPQLRKWLNAAAGRKLKETFGGNIRFFGVGGAKLDPVVEQFLIEAKFPYSIGYGLTETAPLIAGANPDMVKLNSTGPIIEGIEMKLNDVNPKTGEGEIWVRGPLVMQGYYKEPELTKEVLTTDGWFKTGDLAVMDKNDGYLYIKGRTKNVIIGSSGENIYPEEIESIINNFEFVLESLVVEEKGRLVALVHLNFEELENKYKNFKEELDEKMEEFKEELKIYINSKVNKFSAIKVVSIQKTPFEKTPTQKIKRYKYIG
ncbi:MAG: AMP-binding protein [Bacteroidales bacterium]|jgi:long-chain acyl-CoA synthetase|nr:AMP-binding protein [Bacteroidales bacterium]